MDDFAAVSVVIPCFRCTKTICRAVDSIAEQTLRPSEVILVDDCSGDDTLAELYKIQYRHPEGWIKIIASEKNSGPGTARNIGWEAATKPYIAFLDADDSWHPQKIEVQYGWMDCNPDVTLSGHAVSQTDSSIHHKKASLLTKEEFIPVKCKNLLMSNYFATSTVMVLSDINQRFIDGNRYCEDYQLWLNICFSGLKCHYLKTPVMAYQFKAAYGQGGLSSALWKMEKGELAAYRDLYQKNHIGMLTLSLITAWSLLKYTKRLITSSLSRK